MATETKRHCDCPFLCTEHPKVIHYYVGPLMACGVAVGLATANDLREVTCPACIAKMREPPMPTATEPASKGTKIERSKEWWMARADKEGDSPVAVGPPAPPRCLMPGVGPTCGMDQMFKSECKERCLYRCCFCSNEEACAAAGVCSQYETSKPTPKIAASPAPHPQVTEALEARLARLRSNEWMVAVHNDYRQNGKLHTFWLFTRNGVAAKGEGETDSEALDRVEAVMLGEDGK